MSGADPRQLPFLIKLLDDDSEVVRESVLDALSAFGTRLESELERQHISAGTGMLDGIRERLEEHNRSWLRKEWASWFTVEDDFVRLEAALSLLADFMNGRTYPSKVGPLLDQLVADFRASYAEADARLLCNYLFKTRGLAGAKNDFNNPMNSNLVYVIEERRGIPISLACIFMLAGRRLGLDIRGINLPGHFLARAYVGKEAFLVDCFHGGRFLGETDLAALRPAAQLHVSDLLQMECDSETIIARTLRNLHHAYRDASNAANAAFMTDLLQMMNVEEDDSPAQ